MGKTIQIIDSGYLVVVNQQKIDKKITQFDDHNSKIYNFIVMNRVGMSLRELAQKRHGNFTKESICSLGIQLVNVLEIIHEAGFVYNNLNLDCVNFDNDIDVSMLNITEDDIFHTHNINIVNYDLATPYLNNTTKEHISKESVDTFRGNIVFSSLN